MKGSATLGLLPNPHSDRSRAAYPAVHPSAGPRDGTTQNGKDSGRATAGYAGFSASSATVHVIEILQVRQHLWLQPLASEMVEKTRDEIERYPNVRHLRVGER